MDARQRLWNGDDKRLGEDAGLVAPRLGASVRRRRVVGGVAAMAAACCCVAASAAETAAWPGFEVSPHFGEQVATFAFDLDVRVQLNAPAPSAFDPQKPTRLAIFALPNGNTIEQTVGRRMTEGLDWHFDIQHIGAQMRRVREVATDCNWIVAYLETKQKSWPRWCSDHADGGAKIVQLVDELRGRFDAPRRGQGTGLSVMLTCHSGGGRFVLGFIDAVDRIPDWVTRIVFLDANYGYSDGQHGDKLVEWLRRGPRHVLCVTAYDDREMTYNGKRLVGPNGGTYRRTVEMIARLHRDMPLTETDEPTLVRHRGLDGRVEFLLPKNPENRILHTIMVERNGLIHALTLDTPWENKAGVFWGDRAYTQWIQP